MRVAGNVAKALGWSAVSTERNGVAIVARHGFAGPEEWQQLDTSLNDNPSDTRWVVRVPVCLDALCGAFAPVSVAHWYASGNPSAGTTYDRQASQTVAFLQRNGSQPQILIGDLNVWDGPAPVCAQAPNGAVLSRLRQAGYTDAWPHLHGNAEGFTGMTNRANCGNPEGYGWKRIDYAWSTQGYAPVSMTRFGVVPGGEEAPSDHYGIIVSYQGSVNAPAAPTPAPPVSASDAVIYASRAAKISGDWEIVSDTSAAGGKAIQNPDRAAPKRTTALAAPVDYFEAQFAAERGLPYRLWLRGKAAANAYTNDSVFVQFSGSVSAAGQQRRSPSRSATAAASPDGGGATTAMALPALSCTSSRRARRPFACSRARTGSRSIRIVLSPERYLTNAPGLPKYDTTIIPPPSAGLDLVRYASDVTRVAGDWQRISDGSAAGGTAIRNPDRAAAKVAAPLAAPPNFIEVVFDAEAGRPYRVWIRGRADANSWANDSVYVQCNGSLNDAGAAAWRIGSTSAFWIAVEDCSGCGLSGWGWQDSGYGLGVLGPVVYFETTGTQTMRIQQREDGITIDQIVISASRYLTSRPGAPKNDTTIVPR